jgi:hypothetical protein
VEREALMVDYEGLKKPELARLAADRGLPKWGTREDLVKRLSAADFAEGVTAGPSGAPAESSSAAGGSVTLDCGCGPGQSCGGHLPVPEDWPAGMPLPDLEIPVPAPFIDLQNPPVVPIGGIKISARECKTSLRVNGPDKVQYGALLDEANETLRAAALTRMINAGINARAPRLVSWLSDRDGKGGIATYSMLVKEVKPDAMGDFV